MSSGCSRLSGAGAGMKLTLNDGVICEVVDAAEYLCLTEVLDFLSADLGGDVAAFVVVDGGDGVNRTLVGDGGLGSVVNTICRNDRDVCAVRTKV